MGGGSSPCASCKLLRRRCAKDCIFAPYFPPDDPHKFAIVHKVFGASNVSKMLQVRSTFLDFFNLFLNFLLGFLFIFYFFLLHICMYVQELPVHQRGDAVSSLVYEANARMRDPVYGCVGAISYLQNQVSQLQMQLAVAQAEILCIQMQQEQQQQQPLMPHDHQDDQKSLLLATNNFSNINLQHYLTFASTSSTNNVMQDPLKRESLWT